LLFPQDTLTHIVEHPFSEVMNGLVLDKIEIFGNNGQVPTGVNGVGADATLTYDPVNDKVTIIGAGLAMGDPFTVTLTY